MKERFKWILDETVKRHHKVFACVLLLVIAAASATVYATTPPAPQVPDSTADYAPGTVYELLKDDESKHLYRLVREDGSGEVIFNIAADADDMEALKGAVKYSIAVTSDLSASPDDNMDWILRGPDGQILAMAGDIAARQDIVAGYSIITSASPNRPKEVDAWIYRGPDGQILAAGWQAEERLEEEAAAS